MYTATIGKRLIQALNERDGTDWTPRTFFDEVFCTTFYKDERFMMSVSNSPFFQKMTQRNRKPITEKIMDDARKEFHTKVESGCQDFSILIGGAETDLNAYRSGQTTNLPTRYLQEDVYASWIGAGLSIGVNGGLSLLVDNKEVLLCIYDGWQTYRLYLEQTKNLKYYQINAWNSQWLTHIFEVSRTKFDIATQTKASEISLTSHSWVRCVFALSRGLSKNLRKVDAFIFALGDKKNITGGHITIRLSDFRYMRQLYEQLFIVPAGMQAYSFIRLYETQHALKSVAQFGEVGIRAIEPKYLMENFVRGDKFPAINKSDGAKIVKYQTNQLWIIAMLNDNNLYEQSKQLASILFEYARTGAQGRTVKRQHVQQVRNSKSRTALVASLGDIVSELDGENAKVLRSLTENLNKTSLDKMPYFLALLKFNYNYESNPNIGGTTDGE